MGGPFPWSACEGSHRDDDSWRESGMYGKLHQDTAGKRRWLQGASKICGTVSDDRTADGEGLYWKPPTGDVFPNPGR